MNKKKRTQKQYSKLPIILLVSGFVLILIAAVVLLGNGSPISTDSIARISPAEANVAVQQGDAILLDVRSESSYNSMHAQGAQVIPLDDLPSRLSELDPQKWVITYCT